MTDGASVSSDSNGNFTLVSLPRGSYQAEVSANKYQTQTLSFEFSAGLSGNLGDLVLFPVSDVSAPNDLTILGVVLDGVSGLPIQGAIVEIAEPMLDMISDEQGQFFIGELTVLEIELSISAEGYTSQSFTLSASGFGEIKQSFVLPPANANTGQISSILTGLIKDSLTGSPIPDVTVHLADGSISTSSDSSGQFVLNDVSELVFTVQAFATGYLETEQQVTISSHGSYTLDLILTPLTSSIGDQFQIVDLNAPLETAGANEIRLFETVVANLTDQPSEALIIGDIVNASGEVVATVTPYLSGTTEIESHFSFDKQENKVLTIPWSTAQHAPGIYQLVLRLVEPDTISRSLPTAVVLAENQVNTSIQTTTSFAGTLAIQPPITQAGTQNPILLDALIVNSGNVLLGNEILQLSIHDPQTDELLHQVAIPINNMAVKLLKYLKISMNKSN